MPRQRWHWPALALSKTFYHWDHDWQWRSETFSMAHLAVAQVERGEALPETIDHNCQWWHGGSILPNNPPSVQCPLAENFCNHWLGQTACELQCPRVSLRMNRPQPESDPLLTESASVPLVAIRVRTMLPLAVNNTLVTLVLPVLLWLALGDDLWDLSSLDQHRA